MSWYPKELVTCYKCGKSYSTPIDMDSHRRHCSTTRKTYPNGSYEIMHDQSKKIMYIKAPNPFGGMWIMNWSNKLYGAGPDGIKRRGKKWVPHMTDKGWIFQ